MNNQMIIPQIEAAPAWLISRCKSEPVPNQDLTMRFSKGGRNTDLTSLAGSLRKKGLNEEQLYTVLSTVNSNLPEPLGEEEIRSICKSIAKYKLTLEGVTHDYLANLLAEKCIGKFIHCDGRGFYEFNKVWSYDTGELNILNQTRNLVKNIISDLENRRESTEGESYEKIRKNLAKLQSADFMRKTIMLTKSDPKIRVQPSVFDENRHLISLGNGTYNLKSCSFGPFNADDYLNHMLNFDYDADAKCPNFEKFLSEILSEEQASFVMRVFAYALLGEGKEQKLFIFKGNGKNGKSTLLQVIEGIFGPLAVNVQADSITGKQDGAIRNDLARLVGSRIMITNETRAGGIIDAPLLKQITGGDKLTARRLYQEHFEFQPVCVPIIVTNYLPVIDGSDFAMCRRISLITFDKVITNVDPFLMDKLLAEKAGIFNLLIKSLQEYKTGGLAIPESVENRTKNFLERSNLIKEFVSSKLITEASTKVKALNLYNHYQTWCYEEGYRPLSMNTFKDAFERETGIEQMRSSEGRHWAGLRIK